MRYPKAIPLLLLFSFSSTQAATLKGVILANEIGGPPVSNVQITAEGANPTASLSDGTFTLRFPHKEPGEPAKLDVRRRGLVVVNDFQLLLPALPKDPKAERLTLLLCKKGNREEMARRFYRLKSFEAIEKNYKKRITELEANNQATAGALEGARNERDQAKAMADRVAEELARLKPESTSELYQQALSLFLAGKPEEALKLLDEAKLRRSVEAARQRKAEAEKEMAQAIQSYLLKAQLLTTLFRFAEAEKTYQAAIEVAPDSFEAQFGFAAFNQNLNRFPQALNAYGRSLELASRSGTPADVASILNNLGVLYRHQNRMDEARQAFEEALKIRRELARKSPETYLPDVATTLNNLGNLHHHQHRMVEAHQAFEEALKIRRELAQKDPESYLPDVAETLNNLGNLQLDQNQMDKARQSYREALKTFRQLAQKDSETYLPYVAATLSNLGTMYYDQNQKDEAGQAYEEALKICRQLAQKNPEAYLPYVAATLNNLGNLGGDEIRMVEALKIYRELAQKNPETYLPDVAWTLNTLGNLRTDFPTRMDEAQQVLEEAVTAYRQLAQKNPDTYLPDLAGVLNNLGVLRSNQSRMDEARQTYEESLKIRRELAQKSPEIYLPHVAETLNNLGVLHRDQNRIAEARQALKEALGIFFDFAERNPERYEPAYWRVKRLLNDLPE
jgi:tetratricopeptide (TPR) repeat protein